MKRPAIRLLPLVAAIAEAMPPPPTPGEMDSPKEKSGNAPRPYAFRLLPRTHFA